MTNNLFVKKITIDKLPSDFSKLMKEYEKNSPDKVKTSLSGKYQRIEVNIEDNIQLIVYQNKSGVKTAWYVGFDDDSMTCYKRELC